MKKNIKILIMDVDGTLTDGKIYIGENGEVFKAFNAKDGCGIKNLLIPNRIIPIIITGRQSKIVENRFKELGVNHIYQGISDKMKCLKILIKEMNLKYDNIAYIGDDLNDYEIMTEIKKFGGIVAAPKNSCKSIQNIADFISGCDGGDGAVREFIEWILEFKN